MPALHTCPDVLCAEWYVKPYSLSLTYLHLLPAAPETVHSNFLLQFSLPGIRGSPSSSVSLWCPLWCFLAVINQSVKSGLSSDATTTTTMGVTVKKCHHLSLTCIQASSTFFSLVALSQAPGQFFPHFSGYSVWPMFIYNLRKHLLMKTCSLPNVLCVIVQYSDA